MQQWRCEQFSTRCYPSCHHWCWKKSFSQNHQNTSLQTPNWLQQYFHDIEEKSEQPDWVRNPFRGTESSSSLPARLQENLVDLSFDRVQMMAHAEKSLTEFWCEVEKEYPELGKCALNELLPFGSTYMCEVTFSAPSHIKTKQRNRLNVESSLVAVPLTNPPRSARLYMPVSLKMKNRAIFLLAILRLNTPMQKLRSVSHFCFI